MFNGLVILLLSMLSFTLNATESLINYPSVGKNIAYSKVASLDYSPADEKVSYGKNTEQYALLWRSKQPINKKNSPLVILIHGGCWLSDYDIKHTYALSTGLAQAGFNVWSLEYRRSGATGGGWPVTFNDIKAGIFASSRFNNNEFELANSIVIGHSAGGHLALLAGGVIDKLKGVIGLAAITDIEAYAKGENSCQKVTKDFMQGMPEDKPTAYKQANPSKQPLHTHTILLQGDIDNIVPPFALSELNRQVIMVDGVSHFDWIHPGSMAFSVLIQSLNGL